MYDKLVNKRQPRKVHYTWIYRDKSFHILVYKYSSSQKKKKKNPSKKKFLLTHSFLLIHFCIDAH